MKKTGEWSKAESIVSSMVGKYHKASEMAAMREAQFLRKKMVEGIREGAPGGKPFLPLAATTLAVRKRGGKKPLIASGGLRNSITVKKFAGGGIFVGILRTAKGGKINVAETMEFGKTFAMVITPKAHRFLMAKFKTGGPQSRDKKGRFKKGSLIKSGSGVGLAIITIPARPFVQPVADAYAQPNQVRKRFTNNLAFAMGYIFGKP